MQSKGSNVSGSEGKSDNKAGGEEEKNIFSDESSDDEKNNELLLARSVLFVLVMFGISYVLYQLSRPVGRQTGWATLIKNADAVNSIYLYSNYAQVYLNNARVFLGLVDDQHTQGKLDQLVSARAAKIGHANLRDKKGEDYEETQKDIEVVLRGTPVAEKGLVLFGTVAWVVPFVFFPVFVMLLSSSIITSLTTAMEAAKRSQSAKKMIFRVEHTSNTRFHHIAGMKEAKNEVTEVVDFLRHPERYTALGAKVPTGAMLLGPPGTGKTLLAKAVAGESGVGFIPVCGSDFVELYVGMGALRVRQLFEVAEKQRCIVYIDEIDAIGLKRTGSGFGEKQEQEHTLNELLTQLDGFSSRKRGDVMVLASSNVSQDKLDPALIRPGRFDRIIHVDMPVIAERIDIFKVHLSGLKLVSDPEEVAADKVTEEGKAEKLSDNSNLHAATGTDGSTAAEESADERSAVSSSASLEASSLPKEDTHTSTRRECVDPPISTASSLVVSELQKEMEEEKKILEGEKETGYASYDFRRLLANKSERERALINVYAERMSSLCPGFSGADIANVCNEAAILAARENCSLVDITHLERSIDRVLAGIEHRSRVLTPFERRVVAHHEAGHAVAGWFLNRADPLMKVSIVPRGGSALGYAQYLPNENNMRSAAEIRDSISVTLGGRVAEKIFFDHLSTGASDDLDKVARMAYMYVSSFSSRPVYPAPGTPGTRIVKPFGPAVSNEMDVEAKQLVDEIYESTYKLLLSKKKEMEILANHLLESEVLTYDDVVRYLGVRDGRQTDRKRGI
uniref:Putative ATP-dependent zinc metallopeptidase n=1 Tax=Trypanosoma vivax (strain Y486) TaxID=1055687 RepID=G0TZW6_TRYVY|nr:putative ATP-dependent zinc metallopeptidase [Trypanosoma vivax Y486]